MLRPDPSILGQGLLEVQGGYGPIRVAIKCILRNPPPPKLLPCPECGDLTLQLGQLLPLPIPELVTAGSAETLLVIEDQAQMRRNVVTILEMEGFEVLSAENGRLGLTRAAESKPDLIICDVMMPELDGYGVLQALRADKATAALPVASKTTSARRSSGASKVSTPNRATNLRRSGLTSSTRTRPCAASANCTTASRQSQLKTSSACSTPSLS